MRQLRATAMIQCRCAYCGKCCAYCSTQLGKFIPLISTTGIYSRTIEAMEPQVMKKTGGSCERGTAHNPHKYARILDSSSHNPVVSILHVLIIYHRVPLWYCPRRFFLFGFPRGPIFWSPYLYHQNGNESSHHGPVHS